MIKQNLVGLQINNGIDSLVKNLNLNDENSLTLKNIKEFDFT